MTTLRHGMTRMLGLTLVLFFVSGAYSTAESMGGQSPWRMTKDQGAFLLLSDIHFDPFTSPELVPRLQEAPVEEWEPIFSEAVKAKLPDYSKDTNFLLLLSTLAAVQNTGVKYDYAIMSGDFISHGFRANFHKYGKGGDKEYQAFALKTVQYVSWEIQRALGKSPVLFCLGNNDSDCDDYGGITPDSPFLPTLAKDWRVVAQDPEATASFLKGGYYTVAHPTLKDRRFIVFNDVAWSAKYEPACNADPATSNEELSWLKKVLAEAKAKGERVTLLTHMPPGIHSRNASEHSDRTKPQHTFYTQAVLWPFLNVLAPYRDMIDAEFAGHTHMDDFRVVQDRGGKNVFFTHIGPAVCTWHNNNPGFQAILYDKRTGTFLDMATWYLANLSTAGPTEAAQWKLEYTFDEAYGYKAYNAASLADLSVRMENDPKVRETFIRYMTQLSDHEPPATLANWRYFGCAHTHMDPASYMHCYK